MKNFHFTANVFFDAEDIDDAFSKLSKHFKNLKDSSESDFRHEGELDLKVEQ